MIVDPTIVVGCSVRANIPPPDYPRQTTVHDGFTETLKRVKELGLDLSDVPMSTLRMFYLSGLAWAESDKTISPSQRLLWKNSIIYPLR